MAEMRCYRCFGRGRGEYGRRRGLFGSFLAWMRRRSSSWAAPDSLGFSCRGSLSRTGTRCLFYFLNGVDSLLSSCFVLGDCEINVDLICRWLCSPGGRHPSPSNCQGSQIRTMHISNPRKVSNLSDSAWNKNIWFSLFLYAFNEYVIASSQLILYTVSSN